MPLLYLDMHPQTPEQQFEAWRRMTPAEKAAIISRLTQAAIDLALREIRDRYPQETDRKHFLRLAVLRLGEDLARRAYPEITDWEQV